LKSNSISLRSRSRRTTGERLRHVDGVLPTRVRTTIKAGYGAFNAVVTVELPGPLCSDGRNDTMP
jgi:hypothetical protein